MFFTLSVRTIAYHVFCSTLVVFVMGGSRTPTAFKMEPFVTKVNS